MKDFKTLFILFFTTIMVQLSAQENFSIGIRAGYNISTEDLGEIKLNDGYGFDLNLGYRILPHLSAYVGWGWNRLIDEHIAGDAIDFEETGYSLGLEFNHPIVGEDLSLFIKGGAIYNHVEMENNEGVIIRDTKHGWGWQTLAGIDVQIAENLHLQPSAKFHSLKREFLIEDVLEEHMFRYVSFGVALNKFF